MTLYCIVQFDIDGRAVAAHDPTDDVTMLEAVVGMYRQAQGQGLDSTNRIVVAELREVADPWEVEIPLGEIPLAAAHPLLMAPEPVPQPMIVQD
jgi:hypothetical protein